MNVKQVKDFLTTRLPKGAKLAVNSTTAGRICAAILPDAATNVTLRVVSYSEEFPALLRQFAVSALRPLCKAPLLSYSNCHGEVSQHVIVLLPEAWDQVGSSLAADLTWVIPTRALYHFRFKNPAPAFCTAVGNSVWANTYSEAIAAAQKAFPHIPADLTSFVRQEATDESVTQSTHKSPRGG